MSDPEDLFKVWVRFIPRENWLPYETEGMWAHQGGEDTARSANAPSVRNGIAEAGVVRFVTREDGRRWATGRVEASGNLTIRVLPIPDGSLGRSARAVHDRFAAFGLGGEVFSQELPLVAFTVPAWADLTGINALLQDGRDEGWWHFEEA